MDAKVDGNVDAPDRSRLIDVPVEAGDEARAELVADAVEHAAGGVVIDEPLAELSPGDRLRNWIDTVPDRLLAVRPATWVMWTLIAIYVAYFTNRTLDVHHGLGTSAYDSGLYDQGVWLMSRFEAPFVTLMGRNLMGDHSSFILAGLVPLYWVAPGAWILFFSQSAMLGAAALPVYLYARRRLESDWLGVLFGVVFLLHPAVSWTNMENFHPDSFLGLFVALALYGALERKWRAYWIGVVLALLVKEDVVLVMAPLGLWVALKRDVRKGVLTIAAGVWAAVFAMYVVMRSLIGVPTRNSWRIPFGGVRGLIETTLRNPTQLADHLRSDGRLWYLWQMTSPVALVFRRAWGVAAISGVVLFANILSTYWYQYHIQYHYSLIAVPAIVIGTVYALGEIPTAGWLNRKRSVAVVAIASVAAAYTWAPLPGAVDDPSFWPPSHPVAEQARQVVDAVPDGAAVAAHYRIAPHLTYRKEIYQFPNPFRIVLYGPDISLEGTRELTRSEHVEYLVLQVDKSPEDQRDFDVISPAFRLVYSNESWELWQRDRSIPLPPLGGA